MIGLLSRTRLDAIVARFLRELTEVTEPGTQSRLRSDSHLARQELFQLCDGMKHVELAASDSKQVGTRACFRAHMAYAYSCLIRNIILSVAMWWPETRPYSAEASARHVRLRALPAIG